MSKSPPSEMPPRPAVTTAAPADEGPAKLAPLFVVLAALAVLAATTDSWAVIGFVLAIVLIVMLHELAHFVTAKWAGMKVTQFFFGFGPSLWSIRRGETEYGVKAIPAGGYVKIVGMSNVERDVDPADEPRTYRQQPYRWRLAVAAAGSVMHMIIAFVLVFVILAVVGVPRADYSRTEIGELTLRSPAEQAGFRPGDRILAVDGRPVGGWQELPSYIRERPGKPIAFDVERQGERLTLTAVPREEELDGRKVGFVGIGPVRRTERMNPLAAVPRSAKEVAVIAAISTKALGQFFSPEGLRAYAGQLTERDVANDREAQLEAAKSRPVSIYGVTRMAGQAAEEGLAEFLQLLVILNVFVGIFNMVPLPPLDGGHVAIATYERIRSRRGRRYQADAAKLLPITATVVTLLVVMFATSLWLDIVRPLAYPVQ